MAHRVGTTQPVDGRVELERVGPRLRRRQVLGAEQLVALPEQAQLQAARARVDDQNLQMPNPLPTDDGAGWPRWHANAGSVISEGPDPVADVVHVVAELARVGAVAQPLVAHLLA